MNRSRRPDEHLASRPTSRSICRQGGLPAHARPAFRSGLRSRLPARRPARVRVHRARGFAATSDDKLLLFGVNPLHNIVHLAVGALWLASSRSEASARAVSILIGAVYLVVGVLGLFINGSSDLNILNINQPDNALHLASAALGLYFGLAGRRHAVAPTA
jgi:hypothetical protein